MFKNILVANDGSNCGNKAVDLAIDLAVKYNSKISALYVMDFASDLSYDELDDAGGARPKANVKDESGHLWIAKFPSRNDKYDSHLP